MTTRWSDRFVCLSILAISLGVPALANEPEGPQVPVALAFGPDHLLRVALRDARQIATVGPRLDSVVARRNLPFRPASLAWDDERTTLLVGGTDGELLAIGPKGETRLSPATGRGPTRVVPLGKNRAAVASQWGGSVKVVDLGEGRLVREFELPFPVGAMVRRPDGRLIVAAAFGGQLADLDPETGRLASRVIDGVNLRALAISGDGRELLIGHMFQHDSVAITSNNIDAGLVLSSRLSAVRLSEFDDGKGREGTVVARRRLTLDGPRHGAADPSAMAVSHDGTVILIALSGAHQVLKNDRRAGTPTVDTSDVLPIGHHLRLETLEVGQSPIDIVLGPTGELAITADAMSDTLTIVRVADLSVAGTIELGRGEAVRTALQRGEAAFLDGRLAMDRWMSCASCHPGGHTNGLNFDTLGDRGYGAPKNTPGLLGVGETAPYTWTARFPNLPDQIHQSLETSLRGPGENAAETVSDLTVYLQSLAAPPPPPLRRRPARPPGRPGLRGAGLPDLPQTTILQQSGPQERRPRRWGGGPQRVQPAVAPWRGLDRTVLSRRSQSHPRTGARRPPAEPQNGTHTGRAYRADGLPRIALIAEAERQSGARPPGSQPK